MAQSFSLDSLSQPTESATAKYTLLLPLITYFQKRSGCISFNSFCIKFSNNQQHKNINLFYSKFDNQLQCLNKTLIYLYLHDSFVFLRKSVCCLALICFPFKFFQQFDVFCKTINCFVNMYYVYKKEHGHLSEKFTDVSQDYVLLH